MNSLTVGDLQFEVRRSARRRSVQITVDRGGELILTAPEECAPSTMTSFVREKKFWIYTKLAEKDALPSRAPAKKYVTGEGFPYLGRSYRLLLVKRQDVPVKLTGGRFMMHRDEVEHGRARMIEWYSARGQDWIQNRAEPFARRLGVKPTGFRVQNLGYRWGSCTSSGTLNFHWRTMLLPPSIVDYVIVHELVHLLEPHHTPKFWSRVERILANYAERRRWVRESHAASEL